MATVLSTLVSSYNRTFSYRSPSLESFDDEDDSLQFSPFLSGINVPIITISESEFDSESPIRLNGTQISTLYRLNHFKLK